MVSTRGVKFKFAKTETVLCYEPDPTKAKVLYESKVLDIAVRKDKCGRKIPEYRVHFNGWNSSWDRFVPEELMLEDNRENRDLQQLLAQQAIVKLKSNKKRRLIEALLTDKRSSKRKSNMGQVIQLTRQKDRLKRTNSSAKSVKLSILENFLRIPDSLKRQLENDFLFIKHYDKLVRLPCEPNIIFILEDFVQTYVESTLHSTPSLGSHEDCDKRLNLCKEVVDGLRIYFDFTLSNLLLYNSEMKQYEYYTTRFKSDCIYKRRNLSDISPIPTCDIAIEPITNQSDLVFDCSKHVETYVEDSESTLEITDNGDVKSDDDSLLDRTIPIEKESCSSANSTKKIESPEAASPSTSSLNHSSQRFYDLRCRHCQDALNWSLLPSSVYDNETPAPSLIYGAHHLLRLFVKLPDLLSRSNMPLKKLRLLGKHLQTFLRYLDEKREELFHDSDYIEFQENFDSSTNLALVR